MTMPRDWMKLAENNLDAAVRLSESHVPSSVSRAYYAVYCAAHAIAMARGESPPARGNWPHEGLGELVHTVLCRGQADWRRKQLLQFKQAINELQSLRVRADYAPGSAFSGADWVSRGRLVVAMARRVAS